MAMSEYLQVFLRDAGTESVHEYDAETHTSFAEGGWVHILTKPGSKTIASYPVRVVLFMLRRPH